MKLLYGDTTLAIYSEDIFYCIPLWLLENYFSSLERDKNIQSFIELSFEEKDWLMEICKSNMDFSFTVKERNDCLQQNLLDYPDCKIVDDKYLLLNIESEMIIVNILLICEHFKVCERKSIEYFLKLSEQEKIKVYDQKCTRYQM